MWFKVKHMNIGNMWKIIEEFVEQDLSRVNSSRWNDIQTEARSIENKGKKKKREKRQTTQAE